MKATFCSRRYRLLVLPLMPVLLTVAAAGCGKDGSGDEAGYSSAIDDGASSDALEGPAGSNE